MSYVVFLSSAWKNYAIGLEKLSANGQFFVDAQMAIKLLQTTQFISGVSVITAHVAHANTNKAKLN